MIDVSNFIKTLNGKFVAVFGLGLSGLSTVKAIKAAGANVIAWDDKEEPRKKAAALGADVKKLTGDNLALCKLLILSPGVPLHFPEPHDVVKAARASGIEIISDIEILHICNHGRKTIGVTGTNGKSTATALIAHILNESGIEAIAAGNIGQAVLDIDLPCEDGVLVLELSSYQLDLCPTFRPDIALLLNITPDHIDRHGSFEAYKAAKMCMLDGADIAIIEEDTNLAVSKVVKEFGLSDEQITNAIASFIPLPHRQQFICKIGKVTFINDSKATNAESCIFALKNFEQIYLIAGGLAKDGGLNGIEKFKDKIRHVFLIGQDMESFSLWLEQNGMEHTLCGDLNSATIKAYEMAKKNDFGTVLLSPACASFDQFQSFEKRGEQFTFFVNELKVS